jgi:hypothetical protein
MSRTTTRLLIIALPASKVIHLFTIIKLISSYSLALDKLQLPRKVLTSLNILNYTLKALYAHTFIVRHFLFMSPLTNVCFPEVYTPPCGQEQHTFSVTTSSLAPD